MNSYHAEPGKTPKQQETDLPLRLMVSRRPAPPKPKIGPAVYRREGGEGVAWIFIAMMIIIGVASILDHFGLIPQ
jgi:hypothetical protein